MKLITVFTPTYNREKTLKKCYESLIQQTSKNFIWQIVDDGSTDQTEKLIKQFISENKIVIEYYKKDNGGKVSAINMSLEITHTPLWVCLDSDDYLFPDAIMIYEKYYSVIKNKKRVCGLFSVRSTSDGSPMQGKSIPRNLKFETQFNIRYKYHVEPEYVQVYKTDVVRQYKYPIFHGEKYVPLSYTQDQMDQTYRFYIVHEPTMACEYQPDGITKNQKKLIIKNPKGYTEFKYQQILIAPTFLFKIKACVTYNTGCILSHDIRKILDSPSKLLSILCIPISIADYFLRYKKYEKGD